MSVLRPLRSFRRRIHRPTSPCVQELRPQVADEERRPSVIRRLFTRKKTMAVEENLEPVVSEPVVSESEVFNRSLSIGRSGSVRSPSPSQLEEVQSNHTGEINPVVLRVQQIATGKGRPREEPPAEAIPAEEPLAEEDLAEEPLSEELPTDRISGELPSSENLPVDPRIRLVTERPALGYLLPTSDLPSIAEERGEPRSQQSRPSPEQGESRPQERQPSPTQGELRPEERRPPPTQAQLDLRSPKLRFPTAGPNGCAFCGKLYITVPPRTGVGEDFGEGIEVEAYLPCGHKFGHRCLNRYMQALKHEETQPGETQPTRCPWGNCLPLLHRCGHMCTPQRTPPTPLSPLRIMTDKNLPVLHGFCEFCLSDEGYSICQRIGKHRKRRLHHLESSVSSSFLERPFHKASVQYFRIRQRKELQNLDKAVLAHEHSRARNFYNQWVLESRRSQEHRSRTSSRNSQTQGDGTKSQPREDDQHRNNRPQEIQSRGTREQDSEAQGSQIPHHPRRTSVTLNNLPEDSQPGHSLAELIRESQQSTLRRQSVAHPETLEESAKERRILDEMMSLKEPEEVTSMDQVQEEYKRKAEEKLAEDGGEVEEEEQAQKEGKGKGKAKAVEPYYEPMSKRRGSV